MNEQERGHHYQQMMSKTKPEIAIIEPNTLSCLGLKNILENIIPVAIVRTFGSFSELIDDTPDMYVHYFVSSNIYLEHTNFFLQRIRKTIVMGNESISMQLSGVMTLNTSDKEKDLIKNILKLHSSAHNHSHKTFQKQNNQENILSTREIEVLVLISKGYINKEIANKLNISLTTVITHRKNITEKLGIKSVSALTIYAVMSGYIEADSI